MPFTPYHFGPNGFVGLVFRRWIDLPIFLLANVIIDIEVLFAEGWPVHQHWHFHTFLVGGAVCAVFAVTAWPARHLFEKIMHSFHLPYETSMWKMVFSGILGAWLHIFIDAFYHFDVQPFWPMLRNPLWRMRLLSKDQIKVICLAFIVATVILYLYIVIKGKAVHCSAQSSRESTSE
jgi:membrane-bound metal-dependent hydrolase YbcI (DUF457 family)